LCTAFSGVAAIKYETDGYAVRLTKKSDRERERSQKELGSELDVKVSGTYVTRSVGPACHAPGPKKNVTSDNFMRYSTFVEQGPMRGPSGKPSMRVRRENFHIISPSLTRGPAGRDLGVSCWQVVCQSRAHVVYDA